MEEMPHFIGWPVDRSDTFFQRRSLFQHVPICTHTVNTNPCTMILYQDMKYFRTVLRYSNLVDMKKFSIRRHLTLNGRSLQCERSPTVRGKDVTLSDVFRMDKVTRYGLPGDD